MASVAEKLYPPTISSSIPAFYEENGTVTITVPFSMNRAVSKSNVKNFALKIKTAQSNSYLITLNSLESAKNEHIGNRIVKFNWGIDANWKLKIGQYIKVQLAYIDVNGIVGYFSTVAITKFTSKPEIYIEDAALDEGITSLMLEYIKQQMIKVNDLMLIIFIYIIKIRGQQKKVDGNYIILMLLVRLQKLYIQKKQQILINLKLLYLLMKNIIFNTE